MKVNCSSVLSILKVESAERPDVDISIVHLPLTTRFFLDEAKKQHKAHFIDRYLARIPAKLTEVEFGFK
ncbi:hypothetical protein [Lysinibacillus pakistanensis]|uniref:Uncharacterized protein n=1 Tax=Lysinibacillus pakistanensis TaxID=759811 RepID=A0ABX6DAC0_9BACI|nr:hypothetical protein GDS87_12690 [Lysinibacillus pakistanensis]